MVKAARQSEQFDLLLRKPFQRRTWGMSMTTVLDAGKSALTVRDEHVLEDLFMVDMRDTVERAWRILDLFMRSDTRRPLTNYVANTPDGPRKSMLVLRDWTTLFLDLVRQPGPPYRALNYIWDLLTVLYDTIAEELPRQRRYFVVWPGPANYFRKEDIERERVDRLLNKRSDVAWMNAEDGRRGPPMGRTELNLHFGEATRMCFERDEGRDDGDGRENLRPIRLDIGSADWTCVVIWSELVRQIWMDLFDTAYPASENYDTIVNRFASLPLFDSRVVQSLLAQTQHDPVSPRDRPGDDPDEPIERFPTEYHISRASSSRGAFS